MTTEKKYVLEWSCESNGFHIQPVETMLAGNQKLFLSGRSHDYLVLMIGEKEACHRMADNWRPRLIERVKRQCQPETI